MFIGAQYTGYKTDVRSAIYNAFNDESNILSQNRRQNALTKVFSGRSGY